MTDDTPAPEPGGSVAGDDRGVSTTLGYTLTLSISAVLIAGLLIAGGTLIEDQQRAIVTDELTVSGQQLAGGFEDADRLAGASRDGTVRMNVWLPEDVGTGGGYTLRLVNHSAGGGQPASGTVVLSADGVDTSRNVSFRTEFPVQNRTLPGGPVTIRFADGDDDGDRELVAEEQRAIAPEESTGREVVFVDSDTTELSSIEPGGEITTYGVDARAIGPKQVDLDGDGLTEIPYVNAANELRLVDEEGETRTLATDAAYKSQQNSFTSLLTIGEWRGSTSVFYMNTSDLGGNDEATIYRVDADGDPEKVTVDGNGVEANAIAGIGDINDDGDGDLVYVGGSQRVRYIDDDMTIDTQQGVDSDVAIGVGAPRTFTSGQVDRVPFVSSNNVKLLSYVGESSDVIDLTSGGVAGKTYVAGVDWVGDGALEVVYVDSSSGTLQYVTLDGSITTILDDDGNSIEVDEGVGVA